MECRSSDVKQRTPATPRVVSGPSHDPGLRSLSSGCVWRWASGRASDRGQPPHGRDSRAAARPATWALGSCSLGTSAPCPEWPNAGSFSPWLLLQGPPSHARVFPGPGLTLLTHGHSSRVQDAASPASCPLPPRAGDLSAEPCDSLALWAQTARLLEDAWLPPNPGVLESPWPHLMHPRPCCPRSPGVPTEPTSASALEPSPCCPLTQHPG